MADDLVTRARRFAHKAHDGQFRKYGRSHVPYITHPERVARRAGSLAHKVTNSVLRCDEIVAAAYLHDVIEDCGVTHAELETLFGKCVADLVQELTNPSKGSKASRDERKRMDREHIAQVSDAAKLIKLCDRADNLRETLTDHEVPSGFARKYADESVLLLEVLRGIDEDTEDEIEWLIDEIKMKF